jgi:hypothetical protein
VGDSSNRNAVGGSNTVIGSSAKHIVATRSVMQLQTDFTPGSGNALQACVASIFSLPITDARCSFSSTGVLVLEDTIGARTSSCLA